MTTTATNMTKYGVSILKHSRDVDRTFELEVASALAKNRVVDWDFTGRLALTVRYFVPHGWVDDKDKSGVVAKLLLEVKKTLDLPKNYDAEDVDRVHTFLTSEQGSAWLDAWFEPWNQGDQNTKEQHYSAMDKSRRENPRASKQYNSLTLVEANDQPGINKITSSRPIASQPVAHDGTQHSVAKMQRRREMGCLDDVGMRQTAPVQCSIGSSNVCRTTSSPPIVLPSLAVGQCLVHGAQCPTKLLTARNSLSSFAIEAQNATGSPGQISDSAGHPAANVLESHILRGRHINARKIMYISFLVCAVVLWAWSSGIVGE